MATRKDGFLEMSNDSCRAKTGEEELRPEGTRARILRQIEIQTEERGFPPTIREIGTALGFSAPSSVHAHLVRLERDGFISTLGGSARTMKILDKGRDSISREAVNALS
jgi:repressor LexA